jgi:hypothetical protein
MIFPNILKFQGLMDLKTHTSKNSRSHFSNRGCEREFFNAVFPKGDF